MGKRSGAVASWFAVAAGAAIGTSARYGLDLLVPHPLDAFPWSTFAINVVGSFALAWLAAAAWDRVPEWVRAGLGAGLLGSFTTFSAVMISAIAIWEGGELVGGPGSVQPGSFVLAALVVLANVVAGLVAALAGTLVGRRGRRLRTVAAQEKGEDA